LPIFIALYQFFASSFDFLSFLAIGFGDERFHKMKTINYNTDIIGLIIGKKLALYLRIVQHWKKTHVGQLVGCRRNLQLDDS
jgi:hypothetical protein